MIRSDPMVSVIIPTHNRIGFVKEAIDSVLNQTFSNLEVIVVDNGSTDNTGDLVQEIADPRVHYIYQENTGGPAGPRNTGIQRARGKYLGFLDADDLWLPHKLECHIGLLDNDEEVGLIYGQHLPFGSGVEEACPTPSRHRARSGKIYKRLFLSWNFIPCLEALVRKSVIEEVGGFDEDPALKTVEDFDLWLRITRRCKTIFVPEVMSRYRFHGSQLGPDKIEDLYVRNLNIAVKFINNGWVSHGLFIGRVTLLYMYTLRVLYAQKRLHNAMPVSKCALDAIFERKYISRLFN